MRRYARVCGVAPCGCMRARAPCARGRARATAYGERPNDPIRINAQGIGLSLIPLANGKTAYIWHGERWLSAPNNNPTCPDECRPTTGICAEPAKCVCVGGGWDGTAGRTHMRA